MAAGSWTVLLVADELVDVVESFVVAHVDGDPPVFGEPDGGGFVFEPAEHGAFPRLLVGVERVDFDDVAEPVGFVGVFGQVEAFVDPVEPPVAAAGVAGGGDAVAAQSGFGFFGCAFSADEVLVEVFFGGQHRAPGGDAATAVVEHAQDSGS